MNVAPKEVEQDIRELAMQGWKIGESTRPRLIKNEHITRSTVPDRIKPFFECKEPGEAILLFEDEAKLTQGKLVLEGRLRISQFWSPTKLFWEFAGKAGSGAVTFGDVSFDSKKLKGQGRVTSWSNSRLSGYIENGIEIGSQHKLDRVTFHLANFPKLFSSVEHHESIDEKLVRWSEIKLIAHGWQIVLQPHKNHSKLSQESGSTQLPVLNGLGLVTRNDGVQFKRKEAKLLIEALRTFLSFSFAEWCPPMLVVGSNAVANKSWQFWTDYYVEPFWNSRGWLDEYHADSLADAFPGFLDCWFNEKWREPIAMAVSWFIESSSRSSSIDGAIAHGQIPLEMWAWMKFVDDKEIIRSGEFDKLSAATKIQMLLSNCGMSFDVPTDLPELSDLSRKTDLTGPQLAVEIRNTTIHPNKKNREKLVNWETKHGAKPSEVRWQTVLLYREYLTLFLLHEFGYSGEYASRQKHFPLSKLKPVPWVANSPEFKIGKEVQASVVKLLDERRLNPRELADLCNPKVSKRVFGLNYPLLKQTSNLEDRFDTGGIARYHNRIIRGFLICSEWHEHNRALFYKWLLEKTKLEGA